MSLARHCLGCGLVQGQWACRLCRGEPDRRPWALRGGVVQDLVAALAEPWLALRQRAEIARKERK